MDINIQLTKYQSKVVKHYLTKSERFLIQSGAKRSGKTYVNLAIIRSELQRINNEIIKDYNKTGIKKEVYYIIGGPTIESVQKNVINEYNNMFGTGYRVSSQKSTFNVGRVTVACFGLKNADSWMKLRGFNAAGAFLNEATTIHESSMMEAQDRVSMYDGRILMDMNPGSEHTWIYKRFISKKGRKKYNLNDDGTSQVSVFHSTIFDNAINLGSNMKSIINSNLPETSVGYRRNIMGEWCNNDGIVMTKYNSNYNLYSNKLDLSDFDEIIGGFDQGIRHYGVLHIVGIKGDKYYQIDEVAMTEMIESDWTEILKQKQKQYGMKVVFCDSAAQSYIISFRRAGINAVNADKKLKEGTTLVNNLFGEKKLMVNKNNSQLLQSNLALYSYKQKSNDVIDGSKNDDSIDALRYAVYSHYQLEQKQKQKSKSRVKRTRSVRPVNLGVRL